MKGEAYLTDREITAAQPKEKPYTMPDGAGLYVLITPAGAKSWRWAYLFRNPEKEKPESKLMTFGRFPDVDTEMARERHRAARKLLVTGVDPMAERKAKKYVAKAVIEGAFEIVAYKWLEHWRADKVPRHAKQVEARLKRYVLPMLGAKQITAIKAPEIVKMAQAVEATGASDVARCCFEVCGQIFSWAIAHGFAERNPVTDVKLRDVIKPVKTKHFPRVDQRALPELLRKMRGYRGFPTTLYAMELLSLTFLRTSELIGGLWSEIDWPEKCWRIPAERMKMDSPHIVPLSKQALAILEALRELTGQGELIFPKDGDPTRHMSKNTILKALAQMGYKGIMTGHGWRAVASTWLHEEEFDHQHIELQLAHMRRGVSADYNFATHLDARRKIMQAWANFLDTARESGKLLVMPGSAA